jgi:hypothetical protein
MELDMRCCKNVNKPALGRCLVFRNTSVSETRLNGWVWVHLAEFDQTERCVLNLWSSFQLIPLRPLVSVQNVYEIDSLF